MPPADSFPRQSARTRRFTLGQPRTPVVSADGSRVLFLRSPGGSDPMTCLWVYDVTAGAERLLVDPARLLAGGDEDLPAEERARRERARETAGGIVGFAADRAASLAVFSLSGRLWTVDVATGATRELVGAGGIVDPRPDPTGRHVAYVRDGVLFAVPAGGGEPVLMAAEGGDPVAWGLAEFVAAEEMGRLRGYWWAPDGSRLLAARADHAPVQRWWIADPAHPDRRPVAVSYPAAGTPNADVTLAVLGLDGSRVDVEWDRATYPYLAVAAWTDDGPPLLAVQSRDQRRLLVLALDPDTGATARVDELVDDRWVDLVGGVPRWLDGRRLVTVVADGDAYRLAIDGEPVSPPDLQVRDVRSVADGAVLFTASADDPTQVHLWRWFDGRLGRLTDVPGVHGGTAAGGTTVITSATLDRDGSRLTVEAAGRPARVLTSYAETPVLTPRVTMLTLGPRRLRAGLVLPREHRRGERLPVLMAPYGGPHAQRVLAARSMWLEAQWFADQGFAVLVIDGRGTPGRGPQWERAVHGDLATPVLEDQVDGLLAAGEAVPDLDLSRVGIRGWSFGGYLAALAVLRRPDVFHAAVAGAPVTDWRLYDTHYTERYLGDPTAQPAAYDATSLLTGAHSLRRPLLLVHGLADDNVVVAHTLQLSARLLEAGRPHAVLPLSGVTHMTPQEEVAENLLLLQVEFLHRALGVSPPG